MKVFIKKLLRESLNEVKLEASDSMVLIIHNKCLHLFDMELKKPIAYINVNNNEVSGVAAIKGYGPLIYELGMSFVYPNGLQSDRRGNTEYASINIWNKYIGGQNHDIKVKKLSPEDPDFINVWGGGSYEGEPLEDDELNGFMNYKFYNPNKKILISLINNGENLTNNIKSKIIEMCEKFYESVAP